MASVREGHGVTTMKCGHEALAKGRQQRIRLQSNRCWYCVSGDNHPGGILSFRNALEAHYGCSSQMGARLGGGYPAVWQDAHGEDKPLPELTWRRAGYRMRYRGGQVVCPPNGFKSVHSSGRCFESGRIVVTAGSSRLDQRVVLLHELAHHICLPGEHHGKTFWDTAWELFRWAKLPVKYVKAREGTYRKGALVAYRRSR
jgi:hypothetical protein